ncbi:hypothetical protein [Azonexus sp.]|jgi:hypothetical protein
MTTKKLALDQSKLLGFKVLSVKVGADGKGNVTIVGAKIGKVGKMP